MTYLRLIIPVGFSLLFLYEREGEGVTGILKIITKKILLLLFINNHSQNLSCHPIEMNSERLKYQKDCGMFAIY